MNLIDQAIMLFNGWTPDILTAGITSPCEINIEIWEIGGEYYSIRSICNLDEDNWRMVDVVAYYGKKAICYEI